ncbi:hypothetical protein DVH24_032992 [Malus domestica]|uniref:Uncharacterized protein n=1 Tax=Malus domestica TaxID=3750 RepID=A0A498IMD0_MALDO|nr:hypothetical protein DVH24_032992 [Malus domestica]
MLIWQNDAPSQGLNELNPLGRSRRRWDRDDGGGPGFSVEGGMEPLLISVFLDSGSLGSLGVVDVGSGCGGWVKMAVWGVWEWVVGRRSGCGI